MAHLYKRGNIWWMKCQRNKKRIRESTGHSDKAKAQKHMEKRMVEIDGIFGHPDNNRRLENQKSYRKHHNFKIPRVGIFDIETAPIEALVWGRKIRGLIGEHQIQKDWSMLCWTARFLFEGDVMHGCVTPQEAFDRTDASIMDNLWRFLDESDVIIAHNGTSFDIPRANLRLAINGYKPPSPFQIIDTCTGSRKVFGSTSHSQDYLNKQFGLSPKIETNFDLWRRCVSGFPEIAQPALDEMLRYNFGDVYGLEELFMHISPWLKTPVNLSMYTNNDTQQCGTCLSTELERLSSPYTTKAGQYTSFRCSRCGAIGRSRYTSKTMSQRYNSILPTAR
jgi:hypothetical protein